MVVQDVNFLFDYLDINLSGFLTPLEIQDFDRTLHFDDALDVQQIDAAIIYVSGNIVDNLPVCRKENFGALLSELERRREIEGRVKWDFKALDLERRGRISLESTMFLFKAVHTNVFSLQLWNTFLQSRYDPSEDVTFGEVKIFLCNVVQHDGTTDEDFFREYNACFERQKDGEFRRHKSLLSWQEGGTTLLRDEQRRQAKSDRIRSAAGHLLNRMDESGPKVLLQEDIDDDFGSLATQPMERVGASALLDALKSKHDVLKERLFRDMLRLHIGEGMWTAFAEREQQERVMKLKVQEEQLHRDGKIESMAASLPGAKYSCEYTLYKLMGESSAEGLVRDQAVTERVKETGRMREDVEEEFKSILEKSYGGKMTTDELLLSLNGRIHTERDILTLRLQGLNGFATMTSVEREEYFMCLKLILLRSSMESKFQSAAIAAGLTERLIGKKTESDDKEQRRQEVLAKERLSIRRARKFTAEQVIFQTTTEKKAVQGRVDIALAYTEQVEQYFALEREYLIQFLQGKDSIHIRQNIRKMKPEERANQMLVLKTQWKGWRDRSEEEKRSSLDYHRKLLQEATAFAFEARKEETRAVTSKSIDDSDVAAVILSEVQHLQDTMFRSLLSFDDKDTKEMTRLRLQYKKAMEEEWFDNLATVVLGIQDVSKEEEELLKALEDKYDVLRDKLILEALKKQYGEAEWQKLTEQQRQAELLKRKLMERKLRREGRLDEASKLLGDALRDKDLLENLMGMNRQQYLEKLRERLQQKRRAGEITEEEEQELEELENAASSGNILADLQKRFEDEKDALLRRLQEGDKNFLNEKDRQAELARLRLERRRAEQEKNFNSAALVLGLAERNQAAKNEQLKKDRLRQEQLARERMEARKKSRKKKKEEVEDPLPAKGDISGWGEAVMKELQKRHEQERDFFVDLLQDENSEDLRDEAREMTDTGRWERLNKLRDKRDELDFGVKVDQEEHGAVMEMASAVKMIIRQSLLENAKEDGSSLNVDDVIASLLADLQQLQDKENEEILEAVKEMGQEKLAEMRNQQVEDRKYEKMVNVATVVFKYEGPASDDEIVGALDKKYDALMDKLLLDALKKQLGDAEWAALSERERQQRLLKMKLEQKRLLREGRLDEAAKLLGDGFEVDANLRKLMGENRKRYEEMLKEKLARKRERLAKGLPPEDDEEDGIDEGEQVDADGKMSAKDLLKNLQQRYDDEKDALMARLRGMDDKFLSERERQAELARLKRERRRAQAEDKFDAAALVLGLAERNQAAANERLKNDRARQEQLAKERLERMRAKKKAKEDLEIKRSGELTELQEAVMKHIEKRHSAERETLLRLLQSENKDLLEAAYCLTQGNREARLEELKEKWNHSENDLDLLKSILEEMGVTKFVSREHRMTSDDSGGNISKDGVIVSLMADLQEVQDRESQNVMENIVSKKAEELISLQEKQVEIEENEKWDNVVGILGAPEKVQMAGENVLVDALQSKYDALKDKLMLEALEKQMGEAEWAKLSEQERQIKLTKLKLEERRLRREGKLDEAAKLFGDLATQQKHIQAMLGDTRARNEERLKERLAKRKKRQEEGMSEDEILKIEQAEDDQYEEEMKKKSRGNVLLDLEKNFEDEKEALLASLRGADARLQSERARQLELARLRREQKKARQEDKFDAAALVIGMAKAQQSALSAKLKSDRERQERLAKERLQARRSRKKEAEQSKEISEPPLDTNNPLVLQEQILSHMEKKHTSERDLMTDLLNEAESSEWRVKAHEMDSNIRDERLFELKELRSQWRESGPEEMMETAEEQQGIFKEAIALKIETVFAELKALSENNGDEVTDENASVKLLADLQDQQDQEAEYLMKDLAEKSVATLRQLAKVQRLAHEEKWYDNVAAAILGFSRAPVTMGEDFEENLMEALAQKYEALKEKLLIEVLKGKFGEEEWEAMSEKEKQEHLAKLKAEERQLQKEGKLEGDSRFEELSIPSMESMTNQTRAKQEKKLKARMERKRKARELGIDESEVKLDDEEEEKEELVSGSNMLKDLNNQFEAEKDALLAMLRGADAKMMTEKQRQLALAKLRREQRKIKKEEKFDNAILVFSLAKQHKQQMEESYESERSRQEQLARDRIAARRRKREESMATKAKENHMKTVADKIFEEEKKDRADDVRQMDALQREGTVALHEGILVEMEKKHSKEQETLMELLHSAEADKESAAAASYLSESQRQEKLASLNKERDNWKSFSVAAANDSLSKDLTSEEEIKANCERIANEHSKHLAILQQALVFNVESKKQELLAKNYPEEQLTEEISVLILADLQEKQRSETNAMAGILVDKDQALLNKLKEDQRTAKREGWLDNVAAAIFGARPTRKRSTSRPPGIGDITEESEDVDEEAEKAAEEQAAELEKLNEEIEKEKEKRRQQGLSEEEIAGMLADLQKQQELKRQAILAQGQKQREQARRRMEEKRRRLEEKKYEEDVAVSMVTMASRQSQLMREKTMMRKSQQADSLEERLRRRREERKRRAEEEAKLAEKEEAEAAAKQKKQNEAEEDASPTLPLPPGLGLRREKTVVEEASEMEEDKKKEILNYLMREHSNAAMRLRREQTRQEEMVQKLRSRRRQRQEQREQEAAALLGMGERQKTMVEKQKKDERERQITTIRERVNRIKHERTMTMREPKEDTQKGFENYMKSDDLEGLSEDDRMARIAQEMEKKFREEGLQMPTTPQDGDRESGPVEQDKKDDKEAATTLHGGKLDEKAKEQILKERLAQKKRTRRKEKQAAEANADEYDQV